jgi:hypothetical protein
VYFYFKCFHDQRCVIKILIFSVEAEIVIAMLNFATRNHSSRIALHVPVAFVEFDWYMAT